MYRKEQEVNATSSFCSENRSCTGSGCKQQANHSKLQKGLLSCPWEKRGGTCVGQRSASFEPGGSESSKAVSGSCCWVPWCFLPLSVINALLLYCWSGRAKENSFSGNLCLRGVRLWRVLPSPLLALQTPGFPRVRSARCCAPKPCRLRPFAVLLPALPAVALCQAQSLPSVPFSSAGSEYLGAPR